MLNADTLLVAFAWGGHFDSELGSGDSPPANGRADYSDLVAAITSHQPPGSDLVAGSIGGFTPESFVPISPGAGWTALAVDSAIVDWSSTNDALSYDTSGAAPLSVDPAVVVANGVSRVGGATDFSFQGFAGDASPAESFGDFVSPWNGDSIPSFEVIPWRPVAEETGRIEPTVSEPIVPVLVESRDVAVLPPGGIDPAYVEHREG
ncbi:MAG: hypothetical protein AAF805_14140, partial [Planctomycetota bacterium]